MKLLELDVCGLLPVGNKGNSGPWVQTNIITPSHYIYCNCRYSFCVFKCQCAVVVCVPRTIGVCVYTCLCTYCVNPRSSGTSSSLYKLLLHLCLLRHPAVIKYSSAKTIQITWSNSCITCMAFTWDPHSRFLTPYCDCEAKRRGEGRPDTSLSQCQNMFATTEYIAIKFCTDIHESQRMSSNNFIYSSATRSLTFVVLSEISQQNWIHFHENWSRWICNWYFF